MPRFYTYIWACLFPSLNRIYYRPSFSMCVVICFAWMCLVRHSLLLQPKFLYSLLPPRIRKPNFLLLGTKRGRMQGINSLLHIFQRTMLSLALLTLPFFYLLPKSLNSFRFLWVWGCILLFVRHSLSFAHLAVICWILTVCIRHTSKHWRYSSKESYKTIVLKGEEKIEQIMNNLSNVLEKHNVLEWKGVCTYDEEDLP